VAFDPDLRYGWSGLLTAQRTLCDWSGIEGTEARVLQLATDQPQAVDPLATLWLTDDPEVQRRVARAHAPECVASAPRMPSTSGRLTIAYLSADFGNHPVGVSLVELLQKHDRREFEIVGVSLGADDNSSLGTRIRAACDHFIAAAGVSDAEIVQRLRDLGVSIAVDLSGHTAGARQLLLAARPAPVTASYLGYAGTAGMPCVDYIIADPHVIPAESRDFYDERVVWLPDCFMASDTTEQPAAGSCTRGDLGLPEQALVLCAFGGARKLSPRVFDIWMQVLRASPDTVLWLQSGTESARDNLRREAAARGVDPMRLTFAARIESRSQYLGALGLADLFLDTWPYNAHSTARDALWAGVPVLTCAGRSFASRVAASLLATLGLDELVTPNLEAYAARALELVCRPDRLVRARADLAAARDAAPLFSTALLCRHLENAYRVMSRRASAGLAPEHFAVDSADVRT
jgi:predicted O-linked N-acetylglucosamine transferase (SPINDLY family)